ncbi:MAG: MMPL family transporter [Planctomycetota bacterium]|nr:MMPL family transporter [Planctomycetota bacterium]
MDERTRSIQTPTNPPPSGRQRMLERLADWVVKAPGLILVLAGVAAIGGALLAVSHLRLDADTNSLIGESRPFMKAYREYMEEFGDQEALYVVVDAGVPPRSGAARAAIDQLADLLAEDGTLPFVHARISGDEQWRLASWSMPLDRMQGLLMAEGAFAPLLEGRSPEALLQEADARLARLTREGLTLAETESARLGAEALFLLESIAAAPAGATDARSSFELAYPREPRYLVSDTGRMHFIEIMPKKDFGSMAVIAEPLRKIRKAITTVQADHPGIEIGLTGKPVLQADELATTERDMTVASIAALLVISSLFMLVFRGFKRPLFAVLAFVAAFGWTYGIATLAVGRLNLLSMVFMLVLVGAGLDYGVHVVARWIESRRTQQAGDAVRHVMRTAVVGNTTGAVTSAGVFLLALLTSFQGLRELGTIAGIGLLFCALTMTLVLPALLYRAERNQPPTGPSSTDAEPTTAGRQSAAGRGRGWSWLGLIAGSALCLIATAIAVDRLHFESNLLKLQAEGLDSVAWEHRLFEDDTSASWFAVSVVDSIEAIPPVVSAARAQSVIGSIRSVLDLVAMPTGERAGLRHRFGEATRPTASAGPKDDSALLSAGVLQSVLNRLDLIRTLGGSRLSPADRDRLGQLRQRLGAQYSVFNAPDAVSAVNLQTRIDSAVVNTANALTQIGIGARGTLREAIPIALRDRFTSAGGRYAILMQPEQNVWSYEPMQAFVEAIRRVDPDSTGVPITQYESIDDMLRAFLTMGLGAVVVVAVVLWLDFRSLVAMGCCLVALTGGICLTLGALALLGISINLANFFGIPILIGLGADSSIHMLHRWKQMQREGARRFGATLSAVTLTACTTGIGFGALILAQHKGLQSLGWVIALGSLACLLSSTILLVSLLHCLPHSLSRRVISHA